MVRGSTTGSLWNAKPELTGAFPLASVLLSHMSWRGAGVTRMPGPRFMAVIVAV